MYNRNVQQNRRSSILCHSKGITSTHLYSSRLYVQNPVLEIVHRQSVKVYLHMYNGNVQQNPLCAASCVTKDLPISPRFSPTVFHRVANSVLLQINTLKSLYSSIYRLCYVQHPVLLHYTKDSPVSPRFSPTIFPRNSNSI